MFPSAPTIGELHTELGVRYEWTGIAWTFAHLPGTQALVTRTPQISIGPAAPASPLVGDLWFNSTTGFLFIWYDDGSTSQWVVANPGQGSEIGPAGMTGPGVIAGGNTGQYLAKKSTVDYDTEW